MRRITLPLSEEVKASLHAGDAVLLSGKIYTARDAAHKKMHDLLAHHQELPFPIENAVIYYVGPTPARPLQIIGSAGPTTSSRMDPYVRELAEKGLGGMIGKGRRSEEVRQEVVAHHMMYFVAIGGAGALLSKSVVSRKMVAFEELLSEAVTELEVKDFPCFVGLDIYGKDIYDGEENE